MTSVNTNYGALVALQSLSKTTRDLAEVQNRINTGLKVASAKDNGAVFAIAEGQRTRVGSLSSVRDGIDRATSAVDVGLSAGEAIGDILKQMKEKAVAAQATDLSTDQRAALQQDFDALRNQINQIANAATFNGANLVNGTNLTGGSNEYNVLTSDVGTQRYALTGLAAIGYTAAAAIEDVLGVTLGGNDNLEFDVDGTVYNVDVDTGMTVQDLIDDISNVTGGLVTASWNEDTGRFTFRSDAATTVWFNDGAATPAGVDENGIFDGTDGADAAPVALAASGTSNQVTIAGFDLRLGTTGQALETVTTALNISTSTGAGAAATAIDTALTTLNTNLAQLGSQSKALGVQKVFLGKLSDSIEAGIGNLVDADLAKESARLQALQVKQQLGAQALSIANSAPSIILSFFR